MPGRFVLRLACLLGLTVIAFSVMAGPAQAEEPAGIASEEGLDGRVTLDRLPVPRSAVLALGREVWGGRCIACHSYDGPTGAPKITSTEAWAPRIATGLPTLFDHAIGGFMGPKFLEMPPRGGNPDLSDAQVQAAVAFMVWASGGTDPVAAWLTQMETDK